MNRIRVKVCCISTPAEAALAVALGADALGLVSAMPSGPGVISEEKIRRIAATVPPGVATFLLTSATEAQRIIAQQAFCRTNTIQLCDRVEAGTCSVLRKALPGISLVQVVHVTDDAAFDEAMASADHVDALLLDSGSPDSAKKTLGGTGRIHNWAISRDICAKARVPVYLAGGLRANNVTQALTEVRPFGVDLCSGVRSGNILDVTKLAAFMHAVRAFQPAT